MQVTDAPLQIGDRCTVRVQRSRRGIWTSWRGQIIGQSRDGHGWIIRRDKFVIPTGFHKSFVTRGSPTDAEEEAKGA